MSLARNLKKKNLKFETKFFFVPEPTGPTPIETKSSGCKMPETFFKQSLLSQTLFTPTVQLLLHLAPKPLLSSSSPPSSLKMPHYLLEIPHLNPG